jgi:hypothetical protein
MLGDSLAGQGEYAEAEPLLLSSYLGMMERASTIPAAARTNNLKYAGEAIIRLYEGWGKPDLAAQWKQKLENAPAR